MIFLIPDSIAEIRFGPLELIDRVFPEVKLADTMVSKRIGLSALDRDSEATISSFSILTRLANCVFALLIRSCIWIKTCLATGRSSSMLIGVCCAVEKVAVFASIRAGLNLWEPE